MRTLHKFFGVVVLTLTLTLSTSAGQIDLPKTDPATSPSAATADGEMDTPSAAGDIHPPAPASDSVIEVALNLVWGALSPF